jgi:hypothetical protein
VPTPALAGGGWGGSTSRTREIRQFLLAAYVGGTELGFGRAIFGSECLVLHQVEGEHCTESLTGDNVAAVVHAADESILGKVGGAREDVLSARAGMN